MNNFFFSIRILLVGAFWILLSCSDPIFQKCVNAQTVAGSKQIVKKLLIDNWEKSKANREAGGSLLNQAATDQGVLFSYSVNRIQQNRKKAALKSIRTLTALYADDLDALLLKSWLDTVTDDFDTALTDAKKLKSAINNPAAIVDDATRKEVLKRLGRLIGYFSGPVNSKVNAGALDETIQHIVDGLPADELRLLNEQRDKVLAQFEALTKIRDNKLQKVTVEAKQVADAKKQQIEKENKLIEATQNNITPQIDKLRTDGQEQVANLQTEIGPLQTAVAEATRSIVQAESQLFYYQNQIARLQTFLGVDGQNDFLINQQIGILLNQLRFRRIEISQLYRQRDQIYSQLDNLGFRIADTENRFGDQINNLSAELDNTNRAKRRNTKQLGKLSGSPVRVSAKLKAIDEKAESFSTYESISVETLRQKLIQRFLQ